MSFQLKPCKHKNKTHCINGHKYTPENTYIHATLKHKMCKICKNKSKNKMNGRTRLIQLAKQFPNKSFRELLELVLQEQKEIK
jgi:hypothetical protein